MDRKIKWASVVGAVTYLLALAASFGVDVSTEQQQAIVDALTSFGPLVAALLSGYFTHASASDPSRAAAIE